ncbi:MAG: NADH-quinone oxidoreductase subunit M [Thiolinea sp.]
MTPHSLLYTDLPASWPLLSLLQCIPLLAGLLLLRLRGTAALVIALLASLLVIILAARLYAGFDASQPFGVMQYAEHLPLWGPLQYHAAVDGMSVLFVLLTALLGGLCVVFVLFRRWHGTAILAVMLLIQASLISQFVTTDLLWFLVMSVLELLLVAYLVRRWSTNPEVMPALMRYGLFMLVGLLLLLAGMLLLGWHHNISLEQGWSFDLQELARTTPQGKLQTLAFFLLFYGMAIRVPLFPFHGWLPGFLMYSNVTVAATYLLGVKVGVYGLLRFVFPLTPEAVQDWHGVAAAFATVGVFHATLLALQCQHLRRLIAFAVVSHTGILTIGLFTLNHHALQGSVLLALNFGLAVSGLLLMTGLIWQRTGTTDLQRLGGLFDYIPLVGIAFLLAGLAIIGMPGTPGFNAVHFVLEGSIVSFGALPTIAASLGNLIAAGFLLHAFQHVFLGQANTDTTQWDIRPAHITEKVLAGTVILIIVTVGFYDAPWLALLEQPMHGLSELLAAAQAGTGGAQ